MSPMEFLGQLNLLIVGGNDTTRNSISGGVYALNRFPEEYEKLRADPSLIPNMVAEIIRWQTPLAHMRRTHARRDAVATRVRRQADPRRRQGGHVVRLGQPRRGRTSRRGRARSSTAPNARSHVSFGYGVHRCMGNRLGEMGLGDAASARSVDPQLHTRHRAPPARGEGPGCDPSYERTRLQHREVRRRRSHVARPRCRANGALSVQAETRRESLWAVARRGALINVLNPKLSIFFFSVAAAPDGDPACHHRNAPARPSVHGSDVRSSLAHGAFAVARAEPARQRARPAHGLQLGTCSAASRLGRPPANRTAARVRLAADPCSRVHGTNAWS